MEPKTGLRIAFAGCMASGKSFAAASVKQKLKNTHIMSFSSAVKRLARENIKFDHREGYQMVGKVGRMVDPEAWIKILLREINQKKYTDHIVVDDIRYENELIALKMLGFTIVHINTPWHIRLKRVKKRYSDDPPAFDDFVGWFTHESELQLEGISEKVFDHVFTTREEMDDYIKSL